MKKDIIYIDVEDDITAIIGKVKDSKEKIVALVPPKRVGVLQSAVNLRLLQRTAERSGKRVVLITGNQALVGLAAAASIPVARNLQSKPELAEIPVLEVDDGDDVIDGAKLPVSEHAARLTPKTEVEVASDKEAELISGIDIANEPPVGPPPVRRGTPAAKKKAGKKVPNFNTFRKRLVIIIVAALLLIGGLVWAIVFAPAANVIVTAKTTSVPINGVVAFGSETNAEQGTIRVVEQTTEEDVSIEFEATGEEDQGERSAGTVRFSTGSLGGLGTIPAGTRLTSSSGLVFTTDEAATLSYRGGRTSSATVGVTASEPGERYNAASGSLSGAPSEVSATLTDPTSGGTTDMVAIVTAADVQSARQKLVDRSADSARQELSGKFDNTVTIIEASFGTDYTDIKSEPAIGDEASNSKATLKSKVVHRLYGVAEDQLREYLEQTLKQQMQDQTAQKIYDAGAANADLNDFAQNGDARSVRLVANGQIGPVIEESEVKDRVAGRRFGDIQEDLTKIDGVSDVEVDYSYFWVRTVPSSHDKIRVEFVIQGASE